MVDKVKVIEDTISYLENHIYKDVEDLISDLDLLKKEIILLEGQIT